MFPRIGSVFNDQFIKQKYSTMPVTPSVPLISVLMPVRNCSDTVEEAARSILDQSLGDLELIIIDDASSDETPTIVSALNDERVILLRRPVQGYVAHALNDGLDIARGCYLARMDGDDIAHPYRFAKQIEFLGKNPSIELCGTQVQTFGAGNKRVSYPLQPSRISAELILRTVIAHPTAMARRKFFENRRYDTKYLCSQDFELWSRSIGKAIYANLPDTLLSYRLHKKQTAVQLKEERRKSVARIILRNLNVFGIDVSPPLTRLAVERALADLNVEVDTRQLICVGNVLAQLIHSNQCSPIVEQSQLRKSVHGVWRRVCLTSRLDASIRLKALTRSDISESSACRVRDALSLLLRASIRRMRGTGPGMDRQTPDIKKDR